MHWIEFWLGMTNASGPQYLAWSGWASDLGEATIIGGLLAVYRKHNCHRDKCWRFGHYDFTDQSTGMTYKLCGRCHPDHSGKLTAHNIDSVYKRQQQGV